MIECDGEMEPEERLMSQKGSDKSETEDGWLDLLLLGGRKCVYE